MIVVFTSLNKAWCADHFACFMCDQKLNTKSKFYEFDLKPACKKCYEKLPTELRKRLKKMHDEQSRKSGPPGSPMSPYAPGGPTQMRPESPWNHLSFFIFSPTPKRIRDLFLLFVVTSPFLSLFGTRKKKKEDVALAGFEESAFSIFLRRPHHMKNNHLWIICTSIFSWELVSSLSSKISSREFFRIFKEGKIPLAKC